MTGIDIVHIPYRGGAAAVADLVSGQVQMMIDVMPNVYPLAKDRPDPRHRGVDGGAFPRRAGTADDLGVGRRRFRIERVGWRARAGRHAGGDRQPAQRGDPHRARRPRTDRDAEEPRRAAGGRHAAGLRAAHRREHEEVGRSSSRRPAHASIELAATETSTRTAWTRKHCRRFPHGPSFPATPTSSTRRPTKASRRSRSTGRRCATPSGRRR